MKTNILLFALSLLSFTSLSQVKTPKDFVEFVGYTEPIRKEILRDNHWKQNQDNFRLFNKTIGDKKYGLLIDFTDKNNLNGNTEDITILSLPSLERLNEFTNYLTRNGYVSKSKNSSLEEYINSSDSNLKLTKEVDAERELYLLKFTLIVNEPLLYLEKVSKEQQELELKKRKRERKGQEMKPSEIFNKGSNTKPKPTPVKNNSLSELLETERKTKVVERIEYGNAVSNNNGYSPSRYNGGKNTYGLNLRGKPVYTQKLNKDCDETGVVIVNINVDRNGKVINAISGVRGTTNVSPCLLKSAKKNALTYKWKADKNAPKIQQGFIKLKFD